VALLFGLGTGSLAAGTMQAGPSKPDTTGTDASKPVGPSDPKARKIFASAVDWEKRGNDDAALDDYRKANKQDGGECWECMRRAYAIASKDGENKNAVEIAQDWLQMKLTDKERAAVEFLLAVALQDQGIKDKKVQHVTESIDHFKTALRLAPGIVIVHYYLGESLARLQQDDSARSEFSTFLGQDKGNPALHQRAERYLNHIELARATMAPPFVVTTLDGQSISLDSLAGKVVLIDFWATWCGPCREALPHLRQIAKRFEGQPFVVLSISLDNDDAKWKEFVGKNGMTWLQYRDGGFSGRIATQFGVTAIPATFTIDADGVLEDQHVGDADIEGKLKKLIAQAVERNNHKVTPEAVKSSTGGN
jgi:thiol-disulfide isomerase/thioredoxin